MKRKFTYWRLLFLIPAAIFFALSVDSAIDHYELVDRIEQSQPRDVPVAPTQYGEHSGPAIAFACFGLIFVILAFRRRSATTDAPAADPRSIGGPD